MTAYVIIHVTIKDPEKVKEYAAIAGPTVAAAGGDFVSAGEVADALAGQHGYDKAIVIKFPDKATAQAWYKSDEYQAAATAETDMLDRLLAERGGAGRIDGLVECFGQAPRLEVDFWQMGLDAALSI